MAQPPATDYRAVAAQAAQRYNLGNWFLRQIQQESGFNPNAHSSAGAQGIAQFMPATARGLHINPGDPVQALYGAARYDRQLLNRYGTPQRALSAYNSGRPDAYLDPRFAGGQTAGYVRAILGKLTGSSSSPAAAPARTVPPGASASPPGGTDPRQQLALALIRSSSAQNPDSTGFLRLAETLQQHQTSTGGSLGSAPSVLPPGGGGSPDSAPTRGGSVRYLEGFAAPFGVTVTSTTGGRHAPHSYHYQARAVDFGGPPERLARLARAALMHPKDFAEMFYAGPGAPGSFIKNGHVYPNSQLDPALAAEHRDHVHLAR